MSLPLDAAPVTLTVPDREMLTGRVDVRHEHFIEVALLAAPRTPIAALEKHPLFLEWVAKGGVRRQRGNVAFLDSVPVGPSFGVFDVIRFEPTGEEQLLQRREHVRTAITVGVRVRAAGASGPVVRGCTLDVSGGGLLFRGPLEAAVDDVLHFDLEPLADDGRIVRGRCRVVHVTGDAVGVQFIEIDEADRDEIVRFAYDRELAERGKRLAA
jgi:hypothetical protein